MHLHSFYNQSTSRHKSICDISRPLWISHNSSPDTISIMLYVTNIVLNPLYFFLKRIFRHDNFHENIKTGMANLHGRQIASHCIEVRRNKLKISCRAYLSSVYVWIMSPILSTRGPISEPWEAVWMHHQECHEKRSTQNELFWLKSERLINFESSSL